MQVKVKHNSEVLVKEYVDKDHTWIKVGQCMPKVVVQYNLLSSYIPISYCFEFDQ